MLLADMGATVVKVESPRGDDTRRWMPPDRGGEASYYLSVNRNKFSVVLDLTDPADRQAAIQLADRADILIENFRPGSMDKYGLGYEALRRTRPDLVYASVTGFGAAGGAALGGYDLLAQALSGFMSVTGPEDGDPHRAGVAVFDVITGLHAAIGVLAALRHRDLTGQGQRIEVNLLSSALSGMVNQTAAWVTAGVEPGRTGNEHPSLYPYEPMQTGDGALVLAVGNDAQFVKLCDVLCLHDAARDPRYATVRDRNQHRVALRAAITERLAARTAHEWFDILSVEGIPCAPILSIAEGIAFAERLGLDPVAWTGQGPRRMPTVRHPIDFSATPATHLTSPPELGQDDARVRAWLREGGDLRSPDGAAVISPIVTEPTEGHDESSGS
ncbi:CaiB/BaiF CoA transferase family protein [Microbacterium saperdae]|nr:CoA transferase [Microbacterium saperdae]